jgi:predicted nucleic acid-binding protein
MIVVDTSVLISYLQGQKNKACSYLRELEASNIHYAIPNICIQEVLQGAKDEKSWAILNEYLLLQSIISPNDPIQSYAMAAKIYFDCRKKGITVRSSNDCLIAQMVIEHKGILLHADKDFVAISRVRKLKFAIL